MNTEHNSRQRAPRPTGGCLNIWAVASVLSGVVGITAGYVAAKEWMPDQPAGYLCFMMLIHLLSAVVMGRVALRQISRTRPWVMNAVVCATVVVLLAAILFPMFACATEKSRHLECLGQMRDLTEALLMYAHQHDGLFPPRGTFWVSTIEDKVWEGYFSCSNDDQWPSYQLNPRLKGRSLDEIPEPGRTVLLFESDDGREAAERHSMGGNCSFVDGHVKYFRLEAMGDLIWDPWELNDVEGAAGGQVLDVGMQNAH